MKFEPLPDTDGGADIDKVVLKEDKPHCIEHGAMNKVSPMIWRCVHSWPCRAGCMEVTNEV